MRTNRIFISNCLRVFMCVLSVFCSHNFSMWGKIKDMYICSCRVNIVLSRGTWSNRSWFGQLCCLNLIHRLSGFIEILKSHINIGCLAVVRFVMLCFCFVAVRFHLNSVWFELWSVLLHFIVVLLTFYWSRCWF